MSGPEGTSAWDALVNEHHDALDRITQLEDALREIGECVGVLSPHAIRLQVKRALEPSDG